MADLSGCSGSGRFDDALIYASRLHATQRRKGSDVPYVSHLLSVAGLVLEFGGSEDEAIAALLHDAVEDQGGAATREEIRRRFGDTVVAIVDGCTDTDQEPKPPWRERKEAAIATARSADDSVRLVMAADKIHNAGSVLREFRQIGDEVWRRFRGGRDGSLWYYREMATALSGTPSARSGLTLIVQELIRVVGELHDAASEPWPDRPSFDS
jgi:(p)ppGpp synthase/HD superfamily hydrolase